MAKPDIRSEDALLHAAFSLHSNPGAYALLVGAGVSHGSVLTAWEVLEDLISQLARMKGEDSGHEPAEWYQATYGAKPSYSSLLGTIATTATERQALLRGYFERREHEPEDAKRPNGAHHAIARLVKVGVVRIVLTTNFDRLIEQALREVGIEPIIVATPATAGNLTGLHTAQCVVVHLHGDYLDPSSMLNTDDELRTYSPQMLELLGKVLDDYGLLIAGWSATHDHALRQCIRDHGGKVKRYTLNWIDPFPLAQEARELLAQLDGVVVQQTAADAFGKLADSVDALRDRGAHHPLTVSTAIATAKRSLDGKTAAIDLHDEIQRVFAQLDALGDFHLPSYQDPAPYGGLPAMWNRIDEAAKVPCALVATLARWGDPWKDDWWAPEIARFALQARASGRSDLMTLRLVAGASLFYSAGIAAVAGGRYDLLRTLFGLRRENLYNGGTESVAAVLTPSQVFGDINTRTYDVVAPLLADVLAARPSVVDEHWQAFEVVRAAWLLTDDSRLKDQLADLSYWQSQVAQVTRRLEAGGADATDPATGLANLEESKKKLETALDALARRVPSDRVHVLTGSDRTFGHAIPVAARLADAVEAAGTSHPLVQQGLCDDAGVFAAALRCVNRSWGGLGHELAWKRIGTGGGIIVDELWLDTMRTPAEHEATA